MTVYGSEFAGKELLKLRHNENINLLEGNDLFSDFQIQNDLPSNGVIISKDPYYPLDPMLPNEKTLDLVSNNNDQSSSTKEHLNEARVCLSDCTCSDSTDSVCCITISLL